MDNYICKIANLDEINEKWDYEIEKHPDDSRWKVWKEQFVTSVKRGNRICYYGILNGKIISEATAIINKDDVDKINQDLINETAAYLVAFRTIKEYQSQGYFSKLYNFMENDLKNKGYKKLIIGVEPCEEKNKKIYFKWGYTNLVKIDVEEYPIKEGETEPEIIEVEYYYKEI